MNQKLNQVYYENRRDNAASSVYRQDQAESICREFAFIYEKMAADAELFAHWRTTFGWVCYQGCKGMLQRIAGTTAEQPYLCASGHDLARYQEAGAFRIEDFQPTEWQQLQDWAASPDAFYEARQAARSELFARAEAAGRIYIYGAGMVGRQMLRELAGRGLTQCVQGFVVSSARENFATVSGLPVQSVASLEKKLPDALVLIAVVPKYQEEIRENLKKYQTGTVWSVPACLT